MKKIEIAWWLFALILLLLALTGLVHPMILTFVLIIGYFIFLAFI